MRNSVNLVIRGTSFEFDVRLFKAKNRLFKFYYQKMTTFVFVLCSKIDLRVPLIFDKMLFDTSLAYPKTVLCFSGIILAGFNPNVKPSAKKKLSLG